MFSTVSQGFKEFMRKFPDITLSFPNDLNAVVAVA